MEDRLKKFKLELNNLIKISKKKKLKSVIFIGTTIKKKNFFFSKPILSEKFCFISLIVFKKSQCIKICELIDGKINYIFYDIEKKYNNLGGNFFNLEVTVKEKIYLSQIDSYKANDLTLNASELLINHFFNKEKGGLANKKVLIIGLGNIGSKLALKLCESGAKTYCYGKNKIKGSVIVKAINYFIPKKSYNKLLFVDNFYKYIKSCDLVINCTSKNNLIIDKYGSLFSKKMFILDIGKGMFENKALENLIKRKLVIYRLDAVIGYKSFLSNYFTAKKYLNFNSFSRKIIKNKNYISPGILGKKGDIVVDNPVNPKIIFGICDGKGDLKS